MTNSKTLSTSQLLALIKRNVSIQQEINDHAHTSPNSHWRLMDIEHELATHLNIALDLEDEAKCAALDAYFNERHTALREK